MLTQLYILDYAIAEKIELDFGAGMTVLTGETGAGKSIMVGALGLVLGDRADSKAVRAGAERAEVIAAFDLCGMPQLDTWLQERDLDSEGECSLRRVVTADGRSRAYINGRPVPVQSLRELGEHLVDIHGQHDHQSLLRPEVQRQLLDDYAGHADLTAAVTQLAEQWRSVNDECTRLRDAENDRDSRLDLLRFQVQELAELGLEPGEVESLDEEHRRLANADELLSVSGEALQCLYENEEVSARNLISRTLLQLGTSGDRDPKLASIAELLNESLIRIDESVAELRDYHDGITHDPERLQWIEQRLGTIQQLARKHRIDAAELPALTQRLQQELDGLGNADRNLEELEARLARINSQFGALAAKLSRSRRKAAADLSTRVSDGMQQLGMRGGRFTVEVEPDTEQRISDHGIDRIRFIVNANPGQKAGPLARIASGGELSRISLAIQTIAANDTRIPVLVFDEVDAGIGGAVAEVVGRQLHRLSEAHQVLCITHLAQVAAQAHHHLQVSKLTGRNTTRTRIRALSGPERVDEIARMIGGIEITESSRAHAQEMMGG